MGELVSWALLGLLAGGLAKLIMPGKDPGGCLVTIGIGLAGAVIGGFIGERLFDTAPVDGFNVASLVIATGGAFLLLVVVRLLIRRRSHPTDPE